MTIDWNETRRIAESMDTFTLRCALKDAIETALSMDDLDRALGGDRAGKYRDQCSVYRQVLRQRENT
jgi:hypothetical protein